jgi:solute carrier family 5 (sodium-dependent multivitamin transporter), member 6
MNWLDFTIVIVYSIGLLLLGYAFKNQKDKNDYFLGGRSFGWFSMGLSVMASQLSAISFISAAAFVGLKMNGGFQWLTFELAVPLAMIFLIVVIVPPLYSAGIVSIYAYLEKRFNETTRTLISIVFQFSRAFATGIMIYTVALVLSSVMSIPFWQTILIAGGITIIYAYQGGMKAVVWGDVIQMIILLFGIFICIYYGLENIGGWESVTSNMDRSRLEVIDFNWGIGEGEEFGFWPMVIGGFFLYASYYGCDQSQAQRMLSGKNIKEVRRALLFNGLFRFPVTLAYSFMGLIIGTFALTNPEFGGLISEKSQMLFSQTPAEKPDLLIPLFISNYLPHGVLGLLLVAILAAAMSSLSSAINSLSAATVEDVISKIRPMNTAQHLKVSKLLTVFWGGVCIILAFTAGNIAPTVIEAINKVGSAFYGPIVATFILAILSKKVHALAINVALLTGVAVNVYIWVSGVPIFWIWWNLIGAVITFGTAYLLTYMIARPAKVTLGREPLNWMRKENFILVAFFAAMILFCLSLSSIV